MGAIMVGAAVPPEVYASGVLGCAFAVITGTGTATAVALALPVSVFLQVWRNFCYAVPGAFACKKIETALANRDLAKANLYHLTIVPLSIGIPSALLVFGSLFFWCRPHQQCAQRDSAVCDGRPQRCIRRHGLHRLRTSYQDHGR